MRASALPLILAAAIAVPGIAQADMLVGLASASGLKGFNIEKTWPSGSVYVLLGSYQSATGFEFENLTGIIGFRRFQGAKSDASGYFGGAYAGDVDGGPDFNRYGAGGELGYQWVTDHLRITMQAGMALAGESSRGERQGGTELEPVPLLGASISLRF
ncbi:MAG: hypothetical protein ACOY33_05905 [Pseudomonadota bacterium]